MIKLSDAVKDYKSKKHSIYIGPGDVEYLFKMLGDVEIDEDVLTVFLDDLRINPLGSGRFNNSRNYDYAEKEFGIIYCFFSKTSWIQHLTVPIISIISFIFCCIWFCFISKCF